MAENSETIAVAEAIGRVRILNPIQSRQAFDEQVRRHLGMTGDEFIAQWKAGEISDLENPEVRWIVSLLGLVCPPAECG